MNKSILLVAAAIGMLAASCNKEILDPQEDLTQTTITISAKYDSNNSKVTYTESGSNITATWDAGDELIVCWNNHKNTLTLSSGAGTSSATFTGTITGTPSANSTLICFVKDKNNPGAVTVSDNGDYLYTDGTFLGQDGTLAGAAKCNLYYGTCFYGDGSNINCTFNVNTSMMKFSVIAPEGATFNDEATLTYKSDATELAKASFTVGTNGINTIYLSIPAGLYTGVQSITYHCGDATETVILSATRANFIAGQTYSKNVNFYLPYNMPITFEAKVANATVTFTDYDGITSPLEYSTDGISWATYSTPITLVNIGDKVSFRGNNASYGGLQGCRFSCSSECYLYGNIMSLINSSNYSAITTLTEDNTKAFSMLFYDNSNIFNHPTIKIMLPATTLAQSCYSWMFGGCTNLTIAPELPATTLAKACYQGMFNNCSRLTMAPDELPATTLTQNCYQEMFWGCSSLTTAPEIHATTLAEQCCYNMFRECVNLTIAPDLLVSSLTERCYMYMFRGCTSLNKVKCMATSIDASGCTYKWLDGVATTGTFTKNANVSWETGDSGIPSSWIIQAE